MGIALDGQLTSEGSGVGGATIQIIGTDTGVKHLTTDDFGKYSTSVRLDPGTHHIEAHYAGDSHHESSSSGTRIITVE